MDPMFDALQVHKEAFSVIRTQESDSTLDSGRMRFELLSSWVWPHGTVGFPILDTIALLIFTRTVHLVPRFEFLIFQFPADVESPGFQSHEDQVDGVTDFLLIGDL